MFYIPSDNRISRHDYIQLRVNTRKRREQNFSSAENFSRKILSSLFSFISWLKWKMKQARAERSHRQFLPFSSYHNREAFLLAHFRRWKVAKKLFLLDTLSKLSWDGVVYNKHHIRFFHDVYLRETHVVITMWTSSRNDFAW